MANTISSSGPLFTASGLASGIDTATIVDKIIEADGAPMLAVQRTQAAYSVQISTIATLTDKLKAFRTAASTLASTGLAPILASSTYTDFTVTGQAGNQGEFNVRVEAMARAAKMRSQNFTSAQDPAAVGATGNLQFSINGTLSATISVDGKSLADIAEAINDAVPELTASVVSTGTGYRLNVVRKDTGYTTATAAEALQVVSDPGLGLAEVQSAQNASVYVDGLQIVRQSNSIAGAIPGVTLNLTGQSNVTSNVSFLRDTSAATSRMQSFIKAYNDVVATVNEQLRPNPKSSSTNNPIAGTFLYSLQTDMQNLLSTKVNATGTIQTLSDLNVSLKDDGTLTMDAFAFQKSFAAAVDANPEGANQIFSKANTGLGALVNKLVARQVDASTVTLPDGSKMYLEGALKAESKLLQDHISSLDSTLNYWQVRLDQERARLNAQFTAMESILSRLSETSNYLNQMFNFAASNSSSKK